MRVLLVSEVTSYMPGGVPAETRALARGLISRGHDVALLADSPLAVDGLVHHPLDIGSTQQYASRLAAAVALFESQVVHVIAMGSSGLLRLEPALRDTPWVFTCHSISPSEKKLYRLHENDRLHYAVRALRYAPNTLAWCWIFRSRRVPCTIVHSDQVQQTALRYGAPASSIELIPLGVDSVDAATPSPTVRAFGSAPRILTVGGLAHTKGQHDALEAIARLRQGFPDLRYDVLGEERDPSYVAFLRDRIKALGLSEQVALHCNAPESLKKELMDAADLYLQPSHEEGFCLAFIEAAPLVPLLVGTRTGAIAAVCRDDSGAQVVEPRQPTALAEAMGYLLRAALPSDLVARRRRRLYAEFSWDMYIDRHETLYGKLLEA